MITYNIYVENEYKNWEIDNEYISNIAQEIFNFYLKIPQIAEKSCLAQYNYKKISFDFLFCDSKKTHTINKEYRNKDYPADIITFAVFADSTDDERFVLDFEINLGEIIIGLDKIIQEIYAKMIC
mgnify:CR=1 FL=1